MQIRHCSYYVSVVLYNCQRTTDESVYLLVCVRGGGGGGVRVGGREYFGGEGNEIYCI